MMSSQRLLIVDDESAVRSSLFRFFEKKGFQVITAGSVQEAQHLCQQSKGIDLALIDLRLPDGNGIDLMNCLKIAHPSLESIIISGHGTIDVAVEATKSGAQYFLSKPFDLYDIENKIQEIMNKSKSKELDSKGSDLLEILTKDVVVGQSESIKKVLQVVEAVADTDSTVLLTGESGTGKELIARLLHFLSDRKKQAFVPINCGAIPSELLESELFGHVKGAYTGAIANRKGRFELAHNGTILLDEIGDMPFSLQVKLLRVLQERQFEPVGSTKTVSANIRLIASTNIDLEKAVSQGKFREDLYYRLNVIPIHIPSLRERKQDIPVLLDYFVKGFNKSKKRKFHGFTENCKQHLKDYSWPGNVRELENLVERLSILKNNQVVDIEGLPDRYRVSQLNAQKSICLDHIDLSGDGMDFNSAVDSYENALILQALEKTGWNRNQAAILLRLNRTTLVEKIKKKGLTPPPQMNV